MYSGGYSAVVDASKYFYQFCTHPDDRPYLGLMHPVTHVLYEYLGLPMGGANNPGIACRYGLAFIRMLRERFEDFRDNPVSIVGGLASQRPGMTPSWDMDSI
jgi:hypothetical protein